MSRLGRMLGRTGMIAVLIGWFSSSAAADPILLFVHRTIGGSASASGEFEFDSTENRLDTLEAGLFDVELAERAMVHEATGSYRVAQKTDVSTSQWFGSGTAAAQGDNDFTMSFAAADAESVFQIGFRLVTPMLYQFAGTASAEELLTHASIALLAGPDTWIIDGNSGASTRSGLLPAGVYEFEARASAGIGNGDGRAASGFDFDFRLFEPNPVPEPASLLLFGTGAAVVGRTAWRRRREQSATESSDPIGDRCAITGARDPGGTMLGRDAT